METETTTYKLERPISDKEMAEAAINSLNPIFEEFMKHVSKGEEKVLNLEFFYTEGRFKVAYGIGDAISVEQNDT